MAIVLIAGTQFPHHRRPTRRRHNPLHTKRSRTMGSDHRRHPWQAKRQRGGFPSWTRGFECRQPPDRESL